MKETFDAKFIENIIANNNFEFIETLQEKVANLLSLAIEELSQRVPFISLENTILQPVNETFNGAFTPMSKYVYFLGINSPQLEVNSLNRSINFKKLRQRFVQAWYDTKRRKSKRRKKKEEEESHRYSEFEPGKYGLENLRRDLQLAMVKNLSVTSIVYNTSDRLIIQGKDDFSSVAQIEIIPVIYDGEIFKYFISKRKGFLPVNIEERLINFNIKSEIVGENFYNVLKIFNNLFKNITKENVNQIFVESLLYNVPNDLFVGDDVYQVVVNIINYLSMTDVSKFVSIENKKENIFKSKLTGNSAALFNRFMKNLNK